jgi:hypothetical protein
MDILQTTHLTQVILAKRRCQRDSVEFIEGTWEQRISSFKIILLPCFILSTKKSDSVTGPLSKSEFLYIKEKLQVTETLTLR